jgi:dihydrofolate reductase
MSIVSIIAAVDEQNAIGKGRQLLWRLPQDMRRFQNLTAGHTVIMGRKTFESLPKGALPNRRNVVLTSHLTKSFAGAVACNSLPDALKLCEKEAEIFLIGGATVYTPALTIADKLYLTRIHHVFENADVFFPAINFDEWKEIEHLPHPADGQHAYAYTFHTYIRKKTKEYELPRETGY